MRISDKKSRKGKTFIILNIFNRNISKYLCINSAQREIATLNSMEELAANRFLENLENFEKQRKL